MNPTTSNPKYMKNIPLKRFLMGILFSFSAFNTFGQVPEISGNRYDSIMENSVNLCWQTAIQADSRVFWMVSDSNDQPVAYTDSIRIDSAVTAHSVFIGNLQPAVMYRYLVTSTAAGGSDSATGFFITRSESTGKVTVWFNHSVDVSVNTGTRANGNTNFEKLLIEQISAAKHSIDITTWLFENEDTIATCLVNAKERGVKIRFVYNHTADTPQIDTLKAHGIEVVKRNFETNFTMHNKFWIFDHRYNTSPANQYLWTGSTNISHTQFHSDRNNIIIIQDQSLCEVYTREFEEMWGSHTDQPDIARSRFGTEKKGELAHILNVAGTPIAVYFAPTDSIADSLVSLITAKSIKSIYFSMLKFVFPSIETTLHEAWLKGIQVSGVFDSSCSVLHGSAFPRMKGEHVAGTWQPPADVFIDTLPGLIHHKYSLINADTTAGEKIVTTGSFNWELPAQEGNDENMLVIHNATITNLYFQEFMARYHESGGSQVGVSWGIAEDEPGTALHKATCYPNPFSERTTVQFLLERRTPVKLEIYDSFGNRIAERDEGITDAGTRTVTIDGNKLPTGLLLCRIVAGGSARYLKLVHQGAAQ